MIEEKENMKGRQAAFDKILPGGPGPLRCFFDDGGWSPIKFSGSRFWPKQPYILAGMAHLPIFRNSTIKHF